MNITVVYGQRHKGNTWKMTNLFLNQLTGDVYDNQIVEFFLPETGLEYCVGCTMCIVKDEKLCPHEETVQSIVTALDKADLIIFASPCYAFGMTGQLKTLFDHLAYRYMSHRPEPSMFRKQAIAISTAAGAGMGKTTKMIADSLFMWGVATIYRCGIRIAAADFDSIPAKRKKKIESKVNRLVKKIKTNNGSARAGLKTRLVFLIMRLGQKNNTWIPIDKEHWQKHGWLDAKRPY